MLPDAHRARAWEPLRVLRHRNVGATVAERARSLAGDEVIPDAHTTSTMARTIDAPPSAVWPWLVQMGCGRAGFYSFDHLDNGGIASADRIEPAWQTLVVGDRVASRPDGSRWFDVVVVEPQRVLVLRASLRVPSGRPYAPGSGRPRRYSDSTWAFILLPLRPGRTRLLVRSRNVASPRLVLGAANLLFWNPAHLVMQRRQLARLAERAERTHAAATAGQLSARA